MNGPTTASFEYNAPFTPARSRKKRKNKTNQTSIPPSVALDRMRRELLAIGEWVQECKQSIRDSVHLLKDSSPGVLCLGLGSPSSSHDARAQLALVLEACDELSLDYSRISAYDPVFSPEDDELLDDLRVVRITENRNAFYSLEKPTIVFMPHCDLQLYENILRENWSIERLSNLLLIANRLSEYLDSFPSHQFSADFPCVSRLAPHITSRPLPYCSAQPSAFNNIAIQYLASGVLSSLEGTFWILPRPSETVSAHAEVAS